MPFERVLVATDFSDNAEYAMQIAARLAGDAPVHAVHVIPRGSRPVAVGRPHVLHRGAGERESEEEIGRELRHHATEAGVRHVEHRVRHGDVDDEVAQAATDADADLIVVGATGETGIRRAILGSTARGILRKSPTNVLVARGRPSPPPEPLFRRVAMATDFHDPARDAAAWARAIARASDAELLAVHTVDPAISSVPTSTPDLGQFGAPTGVVNATQVEESAQKALHTFNADLLDGEAREKVLTGAPVDALAAFVDDEDVDVLVMGTHGPGPVERFLVGSVAEGVAENAECSVLVVRGASAVPPT